VTLPFLLQQAAWLYDRQLSQVRARMRKVGNQHSASPSPAPGSVAGSGAVGGYPMKRVGSGGMKCIYEGFIMVLIAWQVLLYHQGYLCGSEKGLAPNMEAAPLLPQ
jgi:hypothetical protein